MAALLPMLCSCNDWLTAVSSTQINGYDLFKEKQGFYDALTGIYISYGEGQYGSPALLIPDCIAYPTVLTAATGIKDFQLHEYRNSKNSLSTVNRLWSNSYNVIANINMMLQQLDEHGDLFSNDTERNLFRGELLGMRAYLHFDLLRFFGLADWSGENASKVTVPYVTAYSKDMPVQRSYAETSALLLADINAAIDILAKDPIRGVADPKFESAANIEGYWNNRNKHMNYFAALALKARVEMWMGDVAAAAADAQAVIDEAFGCGAVTWFDHVTNTAAYYITDCDLTMSSEHLLSLEVGSISSYSDQYLESMINTATTSIRAKQSFIDDVLFPSIDPVTGSLSGREDFRGPLKLLQLMGAGYNSLKYHGSLLSFASYKDRVPLIRVSEMYYILAEKHILDGDAASARACLDMVRKNRGIQETLTDTFPVETELAREYYREFYNEGQLMFFLKRTGLKWDIASTYINLKPSDMILPYPDDEIAFGRKQEM